MSIPITQNFIKPKYVDIEIVNTLDCNDKLGGLAYGIMDKNLTNFSTSQILGMIAWSRSLHFDQVVTILCLCNNEV